MPSFVHLLYFLGYRSRELKPLIRKRSIKMKIELDSCSQRVPESNATNANFTRTNNIPSLAGANSNVMKTMNFLTATFFGWEKVTCIVQKQ